MQLSYPDLVNYGEDKEVITDFVLTFDLWTTKELSYKNFRKMDLTVFVQSIWTPCLL